MPSLENVQRRIAITLFAVMAGCEVNSTVQAALYISHFIIRIVSDLNALGSK